MHMAKLPISAAQCRAARALIGWSQDQLASSSGVSKATIANFETSLRLPQGRTLQEIKTALERVGIEFIGQEGVKMVMPESAVSSIERPVITSSSLLSVRLRSRSLKTSQSIVITVERPAIDDLFRLTKSSTQFRRDFVELNLDAITRLAGSRYDRRMYSTGTMGGAPVVSIVLRETDLANEVLTLPDPSSSPDW
jgi:transcriptional regulator with XRE-family HTH domain